MSNKKFVYLFTEGDANMRELLGGKGANLAEMTKIGRKGRFPGHPENRHYRHGAAR